MARLSLYLGRTGRQQLDLIKPDYRPGGENGLPVVTPTQRLPYEATAYLVTARVNTPSWAGFVGSHFDVTGARNVSTAFVLTFRTARRVWALTFGTGFHAIDLGAVEPGFGLRVCANCLDPAAVRSMENRRVGTVTRQQRTHVSRGSPLSELGVVLDQDWVRYLAGRSAVEDLAGTLAGSDALSLTADVGLEDLPSVCRQVIRRFRAKDYQESFHFLDQLRPLRTADPEVKRLEAELAQRVTSRASADLHLAPPQVPDDFHLAGYRVWANRHHIDLEHLDIELLFDALDELKFHDDDLDRIHLAEIGDDGTIGRRDPLQRYIVAEIPRRSKLYVKSLGTWFEVDKDYAQSISAQVDAIEDVTNDLALPTWRNQSEGRYAAMVAADRGWTLLDAKTIRHGGPHQQIELCDLLTAADDHVCIKRASSSATLSHLFNQAAVTCELYRNDPEFRRKAEKKIAEVAPGRAMPDLSSLRFVYAVGSPKNGPLSETLFFFSKLTLIAKATEIRGRGGRVATARILTDR